MSRPPRLPKQGPERPRLAAPLPILYRVPRAAALLGLSPKQIWRWVAAGLIPSVRVGGTTFIPRVQLEAWLQQLPGVSAAEAIRNLAAKAPLSGYPTERVAIDDQERA